MDIKIEEAINVAKK